MRGSAATTRRLIVVALGVAVVGVIGVFVALPDGLPPDLLVAIHEGTTRDSVAQLFGDGGHGEIGFQPWLRLAGPDDTVRLRELAALNLAAWIVATAVWFIAAVRVTGSGLLAAIFVLTCMASLPGINTALSESPAALLALISGLAACLLGFGGRPTPVVRLLVAVPLLAWAATIRFEWALLGGGVLLAEGVVAAVARDRLDALSSRVDQHLSDARNILGAGFVPAAVVAAFLLSEMWGQIGSLLPVEDGDPYRVWITTAVGALPAHLVAAGFAWWHVLPGFIVALAAVGWVRACFHPLRWRGLPYSTALLASLYVAAAHGQSDPAYFEIQRYFAPLLPIGAVFAGFGAAWVANSIAKAGQERGRLAPRIVVTMTACVLLGAVPLSTWPASIARISPWHPWVTTVGDLQAPLDHDVQREVRLLLGTLEANPDCAIVTMLKPIPSMRMADDDGRFLAFSRDRSKVLASRTMADARRELAHDFAPLTCIRVVHGLDCNIRGDNHCDVDLRGLTEVHRAGFTTRAYTHPTERHPRPDRTILAVYR